MCPDPTNPPCEHATRISTLSERIGQLAQRQESMHGRLEEHTKALASVQAGTSELLQILDSWKGAMRTLDALAKVLRPVGYIAAAVTALWGLFHLGGGK